jgi:hypothetical protein
MAAIATPEIILVIFGSGQASGFSIRLAVQSVNRGELLIPVIIICAEAVRLCWVTRIENSRTGRIVAVSAMFAGSGAVLALCVYSLVLADKPSIGWAVIANCFTWFPLAFGIAAGTIAMRQTMPENAESS